MMNPSEFAQASLFAAALETEIADLELRVEAAERRWQQRRRRHAAELDMPERLVRLRNELEEASRMLATLKAVRRRRARRQLDIE